MRYELIRCQIVLTLSAEIISGLVFMLHPIMQLQIPSQLTPRARIESQKHAQLTAAGGPRKVLAHHLALHVPGLD